MKGGAKYIVFGQISHCKEDQYTSWICRLFDKVLLLGDALRGIVNHRDAISPL